MSTGPALPPWTISGGRRCSRREQLESRLKLDLGRPTTLVVYHPVTLLRDTTQEADALFAALELLPEQILFCYPNADAGSRALIERTHAFLSGGRRGRLFVNLDSLTYWSLLRQVDLLLGNSSSGIMETPSFALPTVNIGLRQEGRERARNILDCPPDTQAILEAVRVARSEEFRGSLARDDEPLRRRARLRENRAGLDHCSFVTGTSHQIPILSRQGASIDANTSLFSGHYRKRNPGGHKRAAYPAIESRAEARGI